MKADFEKGTKTCTRCRKELPLSMFGKNKDKSDGLNLYCEECFSVICKRRYRKDVEHSREIARNSRDRTVNVFQRRGHIRGNSGMLKRDYELTEEQLKRREQGRKERRKYRNVKKERRNSYGVLIWYDGKLNNLNSKEYRRELNKEYKRQAKCAIRGYVAKVTPSEHFLFDFDLEQMLKDNVCIDNGKRRYYITKWWKGEIRHWTVNDGIWKE